jgi:T-complex protein 1 subunit alpha
MSVETGLQIGGTRESGQDVRTQNVTAACAVANIVKTSLGPLGLDKMLVDDLGEVTITNDGATILQQLDVQHPAAKVLVELADLQDREVGDGTTSVVILAAELLKHGNELVKNKVHPTSVIQGFRLAMRQACKYVSEEMAHPTDSLGKEALMNAARTSMSSKIIGSQSDFFSEMVVEAMKAVRIVNKKGVARYPLKSVAIVKNNGMSSSDSYLAQGLTVKMGRCSQQMPQVITGAKIACLDFDLKKFKGQMGVDIVVTNPTELESIRREEEEITRKRVGMILGAGANVVLTTKGIDDLAMKYLVEGGVIGVRRVPKVDMQRIAKATGATMSVSLGTLEGEEAFETGWLGSAEKVSEELIGDYEAMMFSGCRTSKAVTIVLRGPNEYMLDEMERSVHDALCVVKRTLESGMVVPGGGCVETALSIYLENFATTLGTREQLAIAEFAEALLIIPRTLSTNAACDSTELVARLRAYHYRYQSDPASSDKSLANYGLNLSDGVLRDNLAAGVLEPMLIKLKSISFATEAAISVLRIDDMIKITPPQQQGQGGPNGGGYGSHPM